MLPLAPHASCICRSSMHNSGWLVTAIVALVTFLLFRASCRQTRDVRHRKHQYPGGKRHKSISWWQLLTSWRFARESTTAGWAYLRANLESKRDHDEASCPICNWGPEPWIYIDDIVRQARRGCQFSGYIKQSIKAFCDPGLLEMVRLVIALRPHKGTMGMQIGSVDSRGWGELELFIKGDSPLVKDQDRPLPRALQGLTSQRDAYRSRSVSQRLAHLRERIDRCMLGPSMCSAMASLQPTTRPPERILKVTERAPGELFVKLCYPNNPDDIPHYSCLSYCWGGDQAYKLTSTTADTLRKGLPVSILPKTLRDAVLVTWQLGVPFLWIDAVCIMQDDHMDWLIHASQMSHIYRGACFTICATRADSADSGFLDEPEWAEPLRMVSNDQTCDRQVWSRPRLPHYSGSGSVLGEKDKRPHMRRAWTYQEDLLSIRCLRFEEEEIIWECLEGVACECRMQFWKPDSYRFQTEMMPKVLFQMQSSEATLTAAQGLDGELRHTSSTYFIWFWHQLIEHYCMRELTNESDRLVALEGIVAAFRWRCHEYYAGIWGIKPLWGLAWEVSKGVFDDPDPRRPRQYRAPSWSWAAIEYEAGSRRIIHPNEEPIPIAEVLCIRWQGIDAARLAEGEDTLKLLTFACERRRNDCEASLLETICFDCGEAKARADACEQFWLVALGKDESNRAERRFDYLVLICEQVSEGKLKRLGITHRAANLNGYVKQLVTII